MTALETAYQVAPQINSGQDQSVNHVCRKPNNAKHVLLRQVNVRRVLVPSNFKRTLRVHVPGVHSLMERFVPPLKLAIQHSTTMAQIIALIVVKTVLLVRM